jgi:hypothetical protein
VLSVLVYAPLEAALLDFISTLPDALLPVFPVVKCVTDISPTMPETHVLSGAVSKSSTVSANPIIENNITKEQIKNSPLKFIA